MMPARARFLSIKTIALPIFQMGYNIDHLCCVTDSGTHPDTNLTA
ncbi:hypothetical protein [Parasedimentitalea maritima]|nr:hypothetical protein [Zongyanglinia marina]